MDNSPKTGNNVQRTIAAMPVTLRRKPDPKSGGGWHKLEEAADAARSSAAGHTAAAGEHAAAAGLTAAERHTAAAAVVGQNQQPDRKKILDKVFSR